MLRPSLLVVLLAGSALIPIACTQNFDLFNPPPGSGAGGGVTGPGAGPSSSANGGSVGSPSSGPSGSSVTSSSAGGAGGAGAGGGGAGGAGGGPTGEIECNDGNDNDGDNKADCADADCTSAGYTCTDTPFGWTGPIALLEQASETLPSCPSAFPQQAFVGHNNPSSPAFTCNACSCDPQAVTCAPASAELYGDATCAGAPVITVPQSTNCTPVLIPVQAVKFPPPTATAPASCNPKGGGVNGPLPAPTWAINSIGCAAAADGKGCGGGNGKACSPPLPAGFDKLCVFKPGNATCPGGFPQKHAFFEDFTDSRACSGCACGAPTAAPSCSAVTTAFSSLNCSGATSIDLANDGSCFAGGAGAGGSFKVKSTTPNAPTCPPSGGAPSGAVAADPATAITVCCQN